MSTPRPPVLVRNISLPVLHNSIPTTHPRPVTRVSSFSTLVKPSLPTRRELTDSDHDDGMVPELPFRSCQTPSSQRISLQIIRSLIRKSLSTLFIFLPPTNSSPHTQLKFMFISAISILLLAPAATLCCLLPSANNLQIFTILLATVPLIARISASVFLSTTLLIAIVMTFTFTASALISPVLLVWGSVVPVITFATLGNRLGLTSSAITAASVAAFDFSEQRHTGNSRIIIVSWLLFLGVLGVVQKQIRALVKNQSCLQILDSSTIRRKSWHFDHHEDHDTDDHLADDSDVEVPDAVLLHGRTF